MYKFKLEAVVRTIVTPDKNSISINVPDSYIGKRIEVLVYATDELVESNTPANDVKDYRGALKLSEKQYNDFQQYVKDGRNEW